MKGTVDEQNQFFAAAHATGAPRIRTIDSRLDAARRLSRCCRRVDRSPLASQFGYPEIGNMRAIDVNRLAALLMCLTSLLTLGGCAPVIIRASSATHAGESPGSPDTIRTLGADQQFVELPIASVAERAHRLRQEEPFRILALSGGGANGAFGAGALVGLARSGTLPQFSVVTGVSAGALIAPYAFLGAEWDRQLTDAYTSGQAEHLLQPRQFGVLFGSSAYRGSPLEHLVEHYLTDELLQAVAREAASGRLLLVATTNVDTGEVVVWDLGSIAMNGGDRAKALFRDVLVASASVPGLFPPVIIRVQEHGTLLVEAHVDGTAAAPFLVPSGLTHGPREDNSVPRPTAVYVIVDGRLSEEPLSVQLRFRSILSRSISVGLTHMMRTNLELTATSAQLEGAHFEYSAIPVAYSNLAPLDFRAAKMRSLFQYGFDCAQTGHFWISSPQVASEDTDRGDGSNQKFRCPADDGLMGRLAVR
jgi:predicted acylesterase/phospholipase RssA